MNGSRPSLSRRLVLGAVVWISLGLGVSGVVLSYSFERTVRAAFEENLVAQLRAATTAIDVATDGALTVADPLDETRYGQVFSGWYWQVTVKNGQMMRSRSLWDTALPDITGLAPGVISFHDLAGPRGQRLRAAATIVNRASVADIQIIAAMDRASLEAELSRFNRIIFAALGTLGLGLTLAVVLQVVVGLRPLRGLTAELKAIRDGVRDRLSDEHPREVAPLAAAFNEVREHDHETLKRARQEVGSLAHALKTPLARLATEVEAQGGGLHERLAPHIADIRGKIDFHAARAATAGARGASARRIDVQAVARDILAALGKIYADRKISAESEVPAGTVVLGEEEDVTEVIGNLLDNAFKWARSQVALTVFAARDGFVVVQVDDNGPGVPPELMPDVVRGRRLDATVPGSGLGLAIVENIAHAYGGTLALQASPMGGLRAIARLPATAAAKTPSA